MSLARRTALMLVDWKQVKMFWLEGRTFYLVTDTGPRTFEFETEAEARSAYEEWMKRGSKSERGGLDD